MKTFAHGAATVTFTFEGTGNASGFSHSDTLSFTTFQVDIATRKQGTIAAPADGLVVHTADTLEFAVSPEFFGTAAIMQDQINWQYCQLNNDGTYTAWQGFSGNTGKGTTFVTTMAGGIYRIRANIGNGTFEYVWEKDEPTDIGTRKKGQPNHIGVCDEQWQINVRNEAVSYIGSTEYALTATIPAENGFSRIPADSPKCSIFVAHCCVAAGTPVPAINGVRPRRYPPLANQWADVPPTAIQGWQLLPVNGFPQPGYVVAHPVAGGTGHCGIVDYDGLAIAAGVYIVHRRADHGLQGINVRYRRYQQ